MVYRQDNRPKRHRGRYTILGIVLGVALTIGGFYVYDNYKQIIINNASQASNVIVTQVEKENPVPQVSHITQNIQRQNQKITNSENNYSIDQLRQITLEDINNYRSQAGINSVQMDNAKASQIWAEHLLSEGCIAHREGDVGPIQRYVDNGDKLQMVFENVSGGYGTNSLSVSDSIKQADSEMMNNDADQNNGHRDNILNPNHTSVSIGIAFNSDKLILIEDFQEPYIGQNWKSFDLAYDDGKSCW